MCVLFLQTFQLEEMLFRSTDDSVMVIMSPWREGPFLQNHRATLQIEKSMSKDEETLG